MKVPNTRVRLFVYSASPSYLEVAIAQAQRHGSQEHENRNRYGAFDDFEGAKLPFRTVTNAAVIYDHAISASCSLIRRPWKALKIVNVDANSNNHPRCETPEKHSNYSFAEFHHSDRIP